MARKTVTDLFIHELSDVYSAEKQITRALPRMARATTNPLLAQAFNDHLEETQGQIERIDTLVEVAGIKLKRMKCIAMEGLVEESKELIEEIDKGAVLDAGLIGAAQKVEHYEIASYGTLATFAEILGMQDAKDLLGQTLEEEKEADERLTQVAGQINFEAEAEGGEEEEEGEEQEGRMASAGSRSSSGRGSSSGGSSSGGSSSVSRGKSNGSSRSKKR